MNNKCWILTEKWNFCKEILDWKYNVWSEEFTGGFKSRLEMAEVRAHNLEDKAIKMIQSEEEREQRLKLNEQSLRNSWENIKLYSI